MADAKVPVPDKVRLCAVDCEASGLHPDDGARVSTVSFAYLDQHDNIVSHAYAFDQGPIIGKAGVVPQGDLFEADLLQWQSDPDVWYGLLAWLGRQPLVFHHARYDLLMLRAGTRALPGADLTPAFRWDTMLAQRLLDPTESAGLKECAMRFWGEAEAAPMDELQQWMAARKIRRYDLVAPEVMLPYAKQDAALTLRLALLQFDRIEQGEVEAHLVQREMQVCRVLVGMERRGIGINQAALATAERQRLELEQKLEAALPFRPSTLAGARRWFFETKNVPPHCHTDKSGPALRECCVRQLVARQDPGAAEWAELVKVRSAGDKWYRPWLLGMGDDGRLRTEFNQTLRHTMRFSSGRFNLQALPHDYRIAQGLLPPRSLIQAAPGYELWEMDLAGAEVRVAARYAHCERMLSLIEAGEDLHGQTAQDLFDVAPDNPAFFEYRQVSKRCNFGLIYNVGLNTFQRDVEKHTGVVLSEQRTRDVVQRWRALYPEFGRINRRAEMAVRQRGYVKLVSGRLRWFTPDEEYHKAFNAIVQGGIAEQSKDTMIQFDRRWPETLVLQIHDSLVVEVSAGGAVAVVDQMCALWSEMATATFKVPMLAEAKPWHKN